MIVQTGMGRLLDLVNDCPQTLRSDQEKWHLGLINFRLFRYILPNGL